MNDHPDWTPRLGCHLEQFAYNELKIIEDQCKHDDEDPETAMQMQHEMTKCIMHMIEAACDCEFSGGTIGYAMWAFKRLMDYKPLTPIYDVPKVWNQVDENGTLQCKRCPSLFKNSDGRAYIVDRNIFETKYHGTYSTGCPDEVAEPLVKFFGIPMKSAEDITFPFIDASSRYIKLNEFEYQIKDMCSDIYGIVHDVKPIPGVIFDPVGYIDTIFILKNGYVVYANCLKNFKSGINSTFKVFPDQSIGEVLQEKIQLMQLLNISQFSFRELANAKKRILWHFNSMPKLMVTPFIFVQLNLKKNLRFRPGWIKSIHICS